MRIEQLEQARQPEQAECPEQPEQSRQPDHPKQPAMPSLATRLLKILLIFVLSAVLCSGLLMAIFFASSTNRDVQQQVTDELNLAKQSIHWAPDRTTYIASFGGGNLRVTWIAADGQVLYDSEVADVATLENHAGRQEVAEALANGSGEATRYSSTLTETTYYHAALLDDGTVLRFSRSQASVLSQILNNLIPALLVMAATVLVVILAARLLTRRIVTPINAINLDEPSKSEVYSELQPLLTRIEKQHAQLGSQAEELAQSRREFTANVSHELKTPLTVVMGYAELMRAGKIAPEDSTSVAGLIYDEAGHIRELVNDILVLSELDDQQKMESIEQRQEVGEVDLLKLTEEVIERLQPFARQNQVELELESGLGLESELESEQGGCARQDGDASSSPSSSSDSTGKYSQNREGNAPPPGFVILGSARVLTSVVYNLTENALRYNRPGGSVLVKLERQPQSIQLTVSDTGLGIASEDQPRVFERFFRSDKTRARETGGTGLGLSIVKHGAEYHNAKLTLKSQQGQGTTITLSFPRIAK
ncbi:MAG: hypothetical protein LBH87_02705 [Coriobacteriales bacterium]|jgi:two-component system phosphate regulon sensor histidine kinase PhoR|nr:hypothetical protein [Coriobacteriales bacterium]